MARRAKNKNTQRFKLQNWEWFTSLGLLILGVVGYVSQEHSRRLEAQPKMLISIYNNEEGAFYVLGNNGTGVATIKWFECAVDVYDKKTWSEVAQAMNLKGKAHYTIPQKNSAMRPNFDNKLLSYAPGEDAEKLFKEQNRISMKICYCSTYNQCWIYNSASGTTDRDSDMCESEPLIQLTAGY